MEAYKQRLIPWVGIHATNDDFYRALNKTNFSLLSFFFIAGVIDIG